MKKTKNEQIEQQIIDYLETLKQIDRIDDFKIEHSDMENLFVFLKISLKSDENISINASIDLKEVK